MYDPEVVFAALPHVNEIWVTDDGYFHLHPHNGGKRIDRDDIKEESQEQKPRPEKVVKLKNK